MGIVEESDFCCSFFWNLWVNQLSFVVLKNWEACLCRSNVVLFNVSNLSHLHLLDQPLSVSGATFLKIPFLGSNILLVIISISSKL